MAVLVEGSSSPTATAACGSVYHTLSLGVLIGAHAETQPSGCSARYAGLLKYALGLACLGTGPVPLRYTTLLLFGGYFTTHVPNQDPIGGRSVLHVNKCDGS